MKDKFVPEKKKWKKPTVTEFPFRKTLDGGFLHSYEDAFYSLPS